MKFEYNYHATFTNRRELEEHLKLEREFQEWKQKRRSGELNDDAEEHHVEADIVEHQDPGYIVVGGYKSEKVANHVKPKARK